MIDQQWPIQRRDSRKAQRGRKWVYPSYQFRGMLNIMRHQLLLEVVVKTRVHIDCQVGATICKRDTIVTTKFVSSTSVWEKVLTAETVGGSTQQEEETIAVLTTKLRVAIRTINEVDENDYQVWVAIHDTTRMKIMLSARKWWRISEESEITTMR